MYVIITVCGKIIDLRSYACYVEEVKMVDNVRRECIMSMYEIYPLSRKLVFDTFDKKKYDITPAVFVASL